MRALSEMSLDPALLYVGIPCLYNCRYWSTKNGTCLTPSSMTYIPSLHMQILYSAAFVTSGNPCKEIGLCCPLPVVTPCLGTRLVSSIAHLIILACNLAIPTSHPFQDIDLVSVLTRLSTGQNNDGSTKETFISLSDTC